MHSLEEEHNLSCLSKGPLWGSSVWCWRFRLVVWTKSAENFNLKFNCILPSWKQESCCSSPRKVGLVLKNCFNIQWWMPRIIYSVASLENKVQTGWDEEARDVTQLSWGDALGVDPLMRGSCFVPPWRNAHPCISREDLNRPQKDKDHLR